MTIDWSKAPEGYPIWVESHFKNAPHDWHKRVDGAYEDRDGAKWYDWQVEGKECTVHLPPQWSGEGLPSVGTHVAVHDADGTLMYGHGESGEVLAHVENTAVIRMSYGLGCFTARNLRTPEQIAAEDRVRVINEMAADCQKVFRESPLQWLAAFEALYHAGYRKQEQIITCGDFSKVY